MVIKKYEYTCAATLRRTEQASVFLLFYHCIYKDAPSKSVNNLANTYIESLQLHLEINHRKHYHFTHYNKLYSSGAMPTVWEGLARG